MAKKKKNNKLVEDRLQKLGTEWIELSDRIEYDGVSYPDEYSRFEDWSLGEDVGLPHWLPEGLK